ncbi:MAG: hypothetical protein KDA85_19060, partial [Planctomycetaceae bacterium]|nr:hypothetical protein [Planctomycetaceae bacterium]
PIARERSFRHGGQLFSNDPENTVLVFNVTGDVDTPLDILPEVWVMDAVHEGQPGKMDAFIGSRTQETLGEPKFTSESGMVTASFTPMTETELRENRMLVGYRVSVEVSPEIPIGRFDETVTLAFDEFEAPMGVKVSAQRFGRITVRPMNPPLAFIEEGSRLNFGQFSSGDGKEIQVLMIVNQAGLEGDFQVEVVESDPPGMTVTLQQLGKPSGDFGRYRAVIAYPPGRPRVLKTESSPGRLHIKGNLPTDDDVSFVVHMNAF